MIDFGFQLNVILQTEVKNMGLIGDMKPIQNLRTLDGQGVQKYSMYNLSIFATDFDVKFLKIIFKLQKPILVSLI